MVLELNERAPALLPVRLERERALTVSGEVLVSAGAAVTPDDVIARGHLAAPPMLQNVAAALGLKSGPITSHLKKAAGETVTAGEIIASKRGFLGRAKTCQAGVSGTITHVFDQQGFVSIAPPARDTEVRAYLRGTVRSLVPNRGAMVAGTAVQLSGIIGTGGERSGPLEMLLAGDGPVTPTSMQGLEPGSVVVVPSQLRLDTARAAAQAGVSGIITPCMSDADLQEFAGQPLWELLETQAEADFDSATGPTLVLLMGFGSAARLTEIQMDHLTQSAGQTISLCGLTDRATGRVPEVLLFTDAMARPPQPPDPRIAAGSHVVLLGPLHGGLVATVIALPGLQRKFASGLRGQVVVVRLSDGAELTLPLWNVRAIG